MKYFSSHKKLLLLELVLLILALLYYLFFFNKGLDLFDEGYYVHSAERIFNGERPYKDFALQYTPAYFYALAFLYKIFGPSVIVGRLLTLSVCVFIVLLAFLILNKLKQESYKTVVLSFFSIISYGYPLINIPSPVWSVVLVSLAAVLSYCYWLEFEGKKQCLYVLLLGLLLAAGLSLRQNLGASFIVLFNFLLFFGKKLPFSQKIKNLLVLNGFVLFLTFCWVYFFFLKDNIQGLIGFITFSRNFAAQFEFTYPPLSYLVQPFGVLKLLPYYLPILYFLFVIKYLFKKNKDWRVLALSLTALAGFFTYIYPNSELLHVYPFLGVLLVSLIIFYFKKRGKIVISIIVLFMIGIGFYLTLFREYYRYHAPYRFQNTQLPLARSQGILTEKLTAGDLMGLSGFITARTSKNDYILSYPYYPMLYFLLDRRNPSKDLIYFPRLWHQYDDKVILGEIKKKNVKYIVTAYGYVFDSALSRYIQKQEIIFKNNSFRVFEIEK